MTYKDRQKIATKKYQKSLKGRLNAKKYGKKYRQENKDKRKESQKKYYQKNREKIQKINKEWRNKNLKRVRELHIFYKKRRRAMKANAEGTHTLGEWKLLKKQYGYRCPCCGKKEPKIKLTEDHIIPLIKGGSDYIENIQPLCRSCNSIKYTKIIKYV